MSRRVSCGGRFSFNTRELILDADAGAGAWQITGSAPQKFDAPVTRHRTLASEPAAAGQTEPELVGEWIWSQASSPPGGQTVTFRKSFQLDHIPKRILAAVTCDNEYTLYLNHQRLGADTDWNSVELYDLSRSVQVGTNTVIVVAHNAGNGPNPAGLYFEAHLHGEDETAEIITSDSNWEWTSSVPSKFGRFPDRQPTWTRVSIAASPQIWSATTAPQVTKLLADGVQTPPLMVRASLLKANELMRALGRPNRDQIVTMRPNGLTTLEAIQLANGQILADAIAAGGRLLAPEYARRPQALVEYLYHLALSRDPTAEELRLAAERLGRQPTPQSVEDLIWAVVMLPEFQLVR